MPERSQILAIAIAVVMLFISAIIFPQAASAWFLNSANAHVARAVSLPHNAPNRLLVLTQADAQAHQARQFADLGRLPLAEARAALARGEPQHAADALSNGSTSLRADFMAQYIWAEAAWQLRQPTVAFEHWRAAGASEYFLKQAYRAAEKDEWGEAADAASIAIGIAPELAEAHYVLGDALSRQDVNDPEAQRSIERAAELTRDNELLATILSRKAEILASQGNLRDALDVFSQARRVAPIDARPRTGYALALLQLRPDAREEATALLMQVVGDSPWYIAAYVALAQIAETRGDIKGAEEWLHKGLANNPNDARLLFPLGEFYARQGRIADARATLTLALKYETHADDRQAIERALERLGTR
jgi:tetratricopeptide (TPR) repeat protein